MKNTIVFFLLFFAYHPFISKGELKNANRNAVELSFQVINSGNFKFPDTFIPEFGYSRYFGNYIKMGAYYQYYTNIYENKNNLYGFKAGFLPFPLFINNENFKNRREAELNLNYTYHVEKGDYQGSEIIYKHKRIFSRIELSRKVYNNFYLFSNLGIWNNSQIFMGIRYKF